MTYVIRMGSMYRLMDEADIEVCGTLPAKIYTVGQNPMTKEYFLEPLSDFNLPSKLYGDTEKRARRVLATFRARPLSTGVHLDGVKGSGKTLLAKTISKFAQEEGIATVVINQPHCGDDFNKFIQSINVPAIIMFDEFEKVYGYHEQEKILTLFDGVYPSKKLFVLTTNEHQSVSRYLKNRPGRIYYSFKFGSLEQKFIEEYLNDNLLDKTQVQNVLKYTKVYSFFNFDMLAACVEEMNRYGETLQEVLGYLNIVPENKADETYQLSFVVPSIGFDKVLEKSHRGFSPSAFNYSVEPSEELEELSKKNKKFYEQLCKNFTDEDGYVNFDPNALSGFDPITNTFTYTIERGGVEVHIVLQRNMVSQFDMNKLAF
jgi:hypothetical protein